MADFSSLFPGLGHSGNIPDRSETKVPANFNVGFKGDVDRYVQNNSTLTSSATKGSQLASARKAAEMQGHVFNIGLKSKYSLMAAQNMASAESIQQRHVQGMLRVQGQIQSNRIQHGTQMRMMGQEQSLQDAYADTIFEVLDSGTSGIAAILMP